MVFSHTLYTITCILTAALWNHALLKARCIVYIRAKPIDINHFWLNILNLSRCKICVNLTRIIFNKNIEDTVSYTKLLALALHNCKKKSITYMYLYTRGWSIK